MMNLSLLTLLLPVLYAVKIPYTFIDFDHVHKTGIFASDPSIRGQTAKMFDVSLTGIFPTSLDGTVGVFRCDNDNSGRMEQGYLPSLTYSAYSLEVIVSIRSFNEIFAGFIIGIFDTTDNTQGNAISFNKMSGQTVPSESNKFFAANPIQNGWRSSSAYFESTKLITDLNKNEYYHVIISQDSNGIVRVYVNGASYGDSYIAPGGKKKNEMEFASLSICGDISGHSGIDANIRAFGFYTEAFNSDTDAKDSCIAARMTDCNGIPRRTTLSPTKEPTSSPVEPCIYGTNYYVHGIAATVSGDPHFQTFNGEYHDFQGRNGQQVYYMHACPGKTRYEMPFSILGRHYRVGTSTITGLDYLTFELYDENKDKYYIWLSASIQNYAKSDISHKTSYYDINPGTNFASNQQIILGKRFKFKYVKSGNTVSFILTIRNDCTVTGYMTAQRFSDGRYRMHYLLIRPPQCYKCYTCGLLGGFDRPPRPGPTGVLKACNGRIVFFKDNDYSNQQTYDFQGWTWEKQYFERVCSRFFPTQRRRLQDTDFEFGQVYQVQVDPDFVAVNPCNTQLEPQVTAACESAYNSESRCCTQIGGDLCDKLLETCKFDACLQVTVDGIGTLSRQITELFIDPILMVCDIEDISSDFADDNLALAPGSEELIETLPATPAPIEPVTYIGNCPCTVLSTDTCNNNEIIITCNEENLSFDETTDAIRSCIDISSSVIPNDIAITNLIIKTKFDHTYVGDVELHLQHNLINVQLVDECRGCSKNNVDVIFNDDAVNDGNCGESNYCIQLSAGTEFGIGGIRKPLQELSAFNGEQANGLYSLLIYDKIAVDAGIFGTWSLEITLSRCPDHDQSGKAIPMDIDNNNNNKYSYKKPVEYKPMQYNPMQYKTINNNNGDNDDNDLWQIIEINILSSILICIFVICICYIIYQSSKCLNGDVYRVQYAGVCNDENKL